MISRDTAALVIDMQQFFLKHRLGTFKLVRNHCAMIEYFADRDLPVAVIECEGFGSTIEFLKARIERVPRHSYFVKWRDDGFTNPNLADWLKNQGVRNVLLTGVYASECVQQTGLGALSERFNVLASEDLINDRRGPPNNNSLSWYVKNGTLVKHYTELLEIPPIRGVA